MSTGKDKSLPILSAKIYHYLPHILVLIGHACITKRHNTLDFMADTGAMTNTYKLSIMNDYCKRYPEHTKAIFDSRNGAYCPSPLVGAIGDDTILPTMSTYLSVVIVLITPYFNIFTQEPMLLTFAYGKDLSIFSILGIPTLMDMGPVNMDLNAELMYTPSYLCGSLPILFKEPTSIPLLTTTTNPCIIQTSHTVAMCKACKALWVNHVQPTQEVRATSSSTCCYGSVYCPINPLLNTYVPKAENDGADYVVDCRDTMNIHGYEQRPQDESTREIISFKLNV